MNASPSRALVPVLVVIGMVTIGSGIASSILAGFTRAGHVLPERSGFTVALAVGAGICLVAAAVSASLGRAVSLRSPLGPEAIPIGSTEQVGAGVVFE